MNKIKLPIINSQSEIKKIVSFIKTTQKQTGLNKAVIGLSGGIDSAVSFTLLTKVLPKENIIPVYMPYFESQNEDLSLLLHSSKLQNKQLITLPISQQVDMLAKTLSVTKNDNIRFGNIMARIRMITLFDIAKKENALVIGTENKSEHLLGYFTRFGDNASDIEPIQHLYKTQVYQLAEFLNIPDQIINQKPSAGLWDNQTDEKEFGFTYQEADIVLYLYFEKKQTLDEITKQGFTNAEKIINLTKKNAFKHKVPYIIE